MSLESLILLTSVFFSVFSNLSFWQRAVPDPVAAWKFALSLFLVVTSLHAFLLGLVANRWIAKPLLSLLLLVTSVAAYYMHAYGIYLDTDMMRNVLQTDGRESSELLSAGLMLPILSAMVPIALLWRVRIRRRKIIRALGIRIAFLCGLLLSGAAGALLSFQDLSSLIRNQREVRYLVTPANYLVSLLQVLLADPPGLKPPRLPIGTDARLLPAKAGEKSRLLVVVIGETARAKNWGLNGYERNTTPELAQAGVINFSDVTSCGSSTEVSLPCMFSPYGRHNYDRKQIERHQSVLHVLQRAGIPVLWRDNQSGCKGICEGLPFDRLTDAKNTALCNDQRCLDEILIQDLEARIHPGAGDRIVVLHQLGNHGPSYFERYPARFRKFTPACETPELGKCSREQIVNAYDNALLYTDHFLATTIGRLKGVQGYDTAMIYVSDHGESLGENGLYLHGVPYAIAPREQTRVPMVMWFSPDFARDNHLDVGCLRRRAAKPASHDYLFSSLLGLMRVETSVYDRSWDLFAQCRSAAG
ncbi:phosphoethanolamine transferase [Pseudoxanthomonas sp. UTMC 1351]|uniref:phosphoethanolamine transferase n=1 Tax=Pseudoxanthomonas sp. UTMC 1351 TaxID=2695853 RepID=UPI0034CE68DD